MKTLTEQDYIDAAELLGCEVAAIKAVRDVESSGRGFDDKGRLIIRFEGHWFRKLTGGRFDEQYPAISHAYYSDGRYNTGDRSRLAIADKLDQQAAFKATSWGMFQVMGFNYALLNYASVDEMIDDFKAGERAQLMGFCRFVQAKQLDDELRRKDWRGFAFGYNGKEYERGKYHEKLEKAYSRYNRQYVN